MSSQHRMKTRCNVAPFAVGDLVNTKYGVAIVTRITGTADAQVHLRERDIFVVLRQHDLRPAPSHAGPGRTSPSRAPSSQPAESMSKVNGPIEPPSLKNLAFPTMRTPSRSLDANGPMSTVRPPPASPQAMVPFVPPDAVRLRQAVEALRFGLVPSSWLERLTVGYPGLKAWVLETLPERHTNTSKAAEICGPFGTGKSHACAVVRHIALSMNYVVAHVEVDGLQVTLADPATLLQAISRSIRAKDLVSATPIIDLYVRAMGRSSKPLETTFTGSDRARDNYQTVKKLKGFGALPEVDHILDSFLSAGSEFSLAQVKVAIKAEARVSASHLALRPVISKSLVERPGSFVSSLVAIARAATLAGYEGLVITVDEFEVERNLAVGKRDHVARLIAEIGTFLQGTSKNRKAPLTLYFASIGQNGHVGDAVITSLISMAGGRGHQYVLTPLSRSDRRLLAGAAFDLYASAYAIVDTQDEAHTDEVETWLQNSGIVDDSGVTRAFVKEYVAVLDRKYGPPSGP